MNQIAILESLMEVLKNQSMVLEQQANDLKCCGNCRRYTDARECQNMRPGSYCGGWLPDGLTRKDRE